MATGWLWGAKPLCRKIASVRVSPDNSGTVYAALAQPASCYLLQQKCMQPNVSGLTQQKQGLDHTLLCKLQQAKSCNFRSKRSVNELYLESKHTKDSWACLMQANDFCITLFYCLRLPIGQAKHLARSGLPSCTSHVSCSKQWWHATRCRCMQSSITHYRTP